VSAFLQLTSSIFDSSELCSPFPFERVVRGFIRRSTPKVSEFQTCLSLPFLRLSGFSVIRFLIFRCVHGRRHLLFLNIKSRISACLSSEPRSGPPPLSQNKTILSSKRCWFEFGLLSCCFALCSKSSRHADPRACPDNTLPTMEPTPLHHPSPKTIPHVPQPCAAFNLSPPWFLFIRPLTSWKESPTKPSFFNHSDEAQFRPFHKPISEVSRPPFLFFFFFFVFWGGFVCFCFFFCCWGAAYQMSRPNPFTHLSTGFARRQDSFFWFSFQSLANFCLRPSP